MARNETTRQENGRRTGRDYRGGGSGEERGGVERAGCTDIMHGGTRSHPYNAGTEHVGAITDQAGIACTTREGGGGIQGDRKF